MQPFYTKTVAWGTSASELLSRARYSATAAGSRLPYGLVRAPTVAAALALAALAPSVARADDAANLEQGINAYEKESYGECTKRFREMLTPASERSLKDPSLRKRARMYLSACLFADARGVEAEKQMEQLILDDPSFFPDRAAFPVPVLDKFAEVRGRMSEEIKRLEQERLVREEEERRQHELQRRREQARQELVERMAKEELRVKESSRYLATIPFGVGQLQNGQRTLGFVLLGVEATFAAASAVTYFAKESIERNYVPGTSDKPRTEEARDRLVLYNRLSFGAFAAVALGGVVHAHVTYVPERRELRERKIPEPVIVPTVSRGGVGIGVVGAF